MASWEIYLFGTPRVKHDNETVPVSRRKTVALLAYLAVNPRPHSRETLATLMWPEHNAAQAKANLRRDLSRLKNVLDEDVLLIDRSQASLDANGDWWLDVQVFQEKVQLIRSHNHFPEQYCADCLKGGQAAVNLYTADFMAGFTLPDSPEFDEWQFFTRESLRQSLAELLQRLIAWHTGLREFEQAIEYGRRWLTMDSLDEPAHRELMRLYAWSGQQAAAIRQYQECVRLLEEELGVPPEPETTALYEAIYARQLPSPTVKEVEQTAEEAAVLSDSLEAEERYEMGDLLAEGGHGEVYMGLDRVTNTKVVIKRIKPDLLTAESEFLTRFQQEGEILARLNHPNIVRMLDTYQREGQYHIVMEYVPGGSLRHLLKREKQLEPSHALSIALELADALGRAHHLGIIHRDLKPENILMAEDGTPRLTDFGVAYLKRSDSRITRTGAILGSPNYICPEIIQDEEIDGRSDIWSLGVVLYEMLAGETPFASNQVVSVLFNIVNEAELSLLDVRPNLPISLVNLIHNMLKKEPARRPASMRQIAAVLEAIRDGRVPESPAAYLTPPTETKAPFIPVKSSSSFQTPHFLPWQTTSFIGREEELAHIRRLLVEEESCRLLTIVGPGGIGKTRLAVEAASRLLDAFPDGVYFVSLTSINEIDFIVPAIAETLQLQFSGPAAPKAQLIHYLRSKKMLLVVDHLEQLLDGGEIISDLLRLAPDTSFIVTARERLQRTEEWSYEISGLSLPEEAFASDQAKLEMYSATQLFLKRASRAKADFALTPEETPNLFEICRALECMPLGLELAAPWVRSHSVGEIATKIEDTLDNLATSSANGNRNYLGLKAVFSQTWAGLTEKEQTALRRLTVFRGGCTREAAEEVAGASAQTLNALLDKALIQQDNNGRYDLHNLIRQLAAEALQEDPEECELIYDIHCRHFLSFLEAHTPGIKVDQEQQILAEMTADADNLRGAWEWAVKYRLLEDLSGAAQGYWLFHQLRGLWYEGETTFGQTAETLINAADSEVDSEAMEQLAGFLKVGQGDLMARRGWLVEGINEIALGLELMGQDEGYDPAMESFALTALAAAQLFQGQFPSARQTAQKSLDLLPKRGDLWGRLVCFQLLGSAAQHQGQLEAAVNLFQACLDICNEIGEQRLQLKVKIGMGQIARLRGSYGRAQQWLDESLEMNRALNNPLTQADILQEQGVLALERGQFEQAIAYLEQSESISEAIGRQDGGLTVTYLGRCHQLQGALDEADDLYRQGLAAAKGADYEPGIALSLLHISLIALDKGRLNQAEQYLQDALVIWQELENDVLNCRALLNLGDVTAQVGEARAADARSYYRQALQLATQHGLAPMGLQAILGVAPLLVRSGEIHQALRLLILTEQHPASSYLVQKATQTLLGSFAKDEVTAVRRETIGLDWIETAEELIAELASASWGQKPVHHNLPVHRSAFFGRQDELADIQKHLLETKARLISVIGPGGIGKTRLAIAAGAALAAHFPQGVFLIPLAPLETADQILITLAEILDVQNLVADNAKEQLLNYLKRKQMLLIFDNYEHLLPQVDFIADIVEAAPNVQMIVTTRQRLNLGAELVYTLRGMSYPAISDSELEKLAAYDAVQLLVGHARNIRPEVDIETEEYEHIIRICHLVEGMPLALVLAANWLNMLSFAEIAEEIEESLDFLESERGDLPLRQRSVRAVFNGSWARLPKAAQETFARLTVFRGGFSREGARAVCKTSLRDLRTLVNSSFVTVSTTGRYEVHELMRQLGAEQLAAMGTADSTKTDHSNYYLSLLAKLEEDLRGNRQIEGLFQILADFDNIRSAWNWALRQGDRQGINQAQECLHLFFDMQGRYGEGRAFFRRAKEAFGPGPGEEVDATYGRILTRYGFLGIIIGRPRDGISADLQRGLAIAIEHDDRHEIAINHLAQSSLLEDLEVDLERYLEAKQIFEELKDDFYLSRACVHLSNCYGFLNDLDNAKFYVEEGVRISRSTGSIVNLALALGNLSEIEITFGQYELAKEHIEEALKSAEKIHAWLLVSFGYCISGFNHLLVGEMSEAEKGIRKGLTLAEEFDHLYLKAFSLSMLSLWAGLTGQANSGLEWGRESEALAANNMMGLVLVPWGMSVNYSRLGRWKEAAEALVNAFKEAESQSLPAPLVWLMGSAALIAAEKGELKTAVRFLSIAKNHPFGATDWMMAWPHQAELEANLRDKLDKADFEAAWADGETYQAELLSPEILQAVYDILKAN